MAKFKPEVFRLQITHCTASQLKLECGLISKHDTLRKYQQDFLQLPTVGSILLLLGFMGRLGASLFFENIDSQVVIYILLFSVISGVLLVAWLMLTSDFYVCWILDRRSNELIHITRNFLATNKKRYDLSDFRGVNIRYPKKTFLNQYILTLVRKNKGWLALERQSIEERTDLDLTTQHYQDLAKTICEFMRWPI